MEDVSKFFTYVADADPYQAKAIISKYGYSLQGVNGNDPVALGECLSQLVAAEGEKAFRDIASIHPDKDVLLELFSAQPSAGIETTQAPAPCTGCKEKSSVDAYVQAATTTSGFSLQNGTTVLIAATLICVVAIVVAHK